MLGYTLSKLNLLILVTALFAIIAFFLINVEWIMISLSAQGRVNNYSSQIQGILSGDDYCSKTTLTVPEAIEYFGGLNSSKRYYYVLYFKRISEEQQQEGESMLVLQMASRIEQDKTIATAHVLTDAKFYLYEWDPENDILTEQSSMKIDPLSKGLPKNSFVVLKLVQDGKKQLHIVACSSSASVCDTNLEKLGLDC